MSWERLEPPISALHGYRNGGVTLSRHIKIIN